MGDSLKSLASLRTIQELDLNCSKRTQKLTLLNRKLNKKIFMDWFKGLGYEDLKIKS